MMEVQKFIKLNGLEALKEELGIRIREYEDDGLIVLNYSQIDSPKTNPIVRECRGLILDRVTYEVYCRTFERFYNYGEAPETTEGFDLNRANAYDKLDGSLIKVWYDPRRDKWFCGTRGTAYGETDVYGFPVVFNQLVYRAINLADGDEFDYRCKQNLDKNLTYMFEVTSFENRVVTLYEESNLWFLGAIDTKTGQTIGYDIPSNFGSIDAPFQKFESMAECEKVASELPDLKEGYVLHDPVSDIRIKVKSPTYVIYHHIKGEGLSPKHIKELVVKNEQVEYLLKFPDDLRFFEPYIELLENMLAEINDTYSSSREIVSQKEFALSIRGKTFTHILFQARGKSKEPSDIWSGMSVDDRYKTLSSYENSQSIDE